jgi:hypothetical protein
MAESSHGDLVDYEFMHGAKQLRDDSAELEFGRSLPADLPPT